MVTRKSRKEIEKMRVAGRIVAEVLALVESELRPGVSTGHLDRLAERHIRSSAMVLHFFCVSYETDAANREHKAQLRDRLLRELDAPR